MCRTNMPRTQSAQESTRRMSRFCRTFPILFHFYLNFTTTTCGSTNSFFIPPSTGFKPLTHLTLGLKAPVLMRQRHCLLSPIVYCLLLLSSFPIVLFVLPRSIVLSPLLSSGLPCKRSPAQPGPCAGPEQYIYLSTCTPSPHLDLLVFTG